MGHEAIITIILSIYGLKRCEINFNPASTPSHEYFIRGGYNFHDSLSVQIETLFDIRFRARIFCLETFFVTSLLRYCESDGSSITGV